MFERSTLLVTWFRLYRLQVQLCIVMHRPYCFMHVILNGLCTCCCGVRHSRWFWQQHRHRRRYRHCHRHRYRHRHRHRHRYRHCHRHRHRYRHRHRHHYQHGYYCFTCILSLLLQTITVVWY